MKSKSSLKKWIEEKKEEKNNLHETEIFKKVDSEFLKKFRHELHLTQLQLAKVLGVSKKTIEKWEQGKNPLLGPAARLVYLIHQNPKIILELQLEES
ncbi:conserved hypothetical protein [Alteracholeplasma palmae J233]|uniref:HTH cro/C1-type domain-containing protein n=1 Tax=Alteracholeplasma palmae (strain ATCC 49389 / J233) TaxID=1318466 RepID=U4KS87_ALTPJ|nr:helix-turn-helix domain-containing protein [Alteracholeplasma palmae]CCV64821.1 conserved hypothetical protein [Alteracholeplasma palmae J233]